MSSGMRYFTPQVEETDIPEYLERDRKERQQKVLGLFKRFYDEKPMVSSPEKSVFGSADNYSKVPNPSPGDMMSCKTGLMPDKIEYPDEPIFPEVNTLTSPMGDFGRFENRQYRMVYEKNGFERLWRDRFNPNPRPSGV
jgi:hypothetical protein